MQNLSPNFSVEEACFSDTAARLGLDNTPDSRVLGNMIFAAEQLELLRKALGSPIIITSWYRGEKLNDSISGSSKTSAHMQGYAIDCHVKGMSVYDLCTFASKHCNMYDQIIHEYGRWMHISFDVKNRKKLTTIFSGGSGYKSGLLTEQAYRQS